MTDIIGEIIEEIGGERIEGNYFEINNSDYEDDPLTGQPIKNCNDQVEKLWNLDLDNTKKLLGDKELQENYFPGQNFVLESKTNLVRGSNENDIFLLNGLDEDKTIIENFNPLEDTLVVYGVNPELINFSSVENSNSLTLISIEGEGDIGLFNGLSIGEAQQSFCH